MSLRALVLTFASAVAGALAYASITLTNPIVINSGATQVENNTQSGLMALHTDFGAGGGSPILTGIFHAGVVSGQVITQSKYAPQVSILVNLTTGAWTGSNGTSGTLTSAQLTTIVNALKSVRNQIEVFAVNNGVIAGSQVSW